MNSDTLVRSLVFWNMSYYFRMKNVKNFQTAKVKPRGVAQHLLEFLAISACLCLCNFAKIGCCSPDNFFLDFRLSCFFIAPTENSAKSSNVVTTKIKNVQVLKCQISKSMVANVQAQYVAALCTVMDFQFNRQLKIGQILLR